MIQVNLLLIITGLTLGSFVNALVWRVRQNDLISSKHKGGAATNTKKYSIVNGRSMCPKCKHQLSVLDLIPVVSWALLRGKCRYCEKPISAQYPLVELLTGLLFLISWLYWPWEVASVLGYLTFFLWLAVVTISVALAVYDLKWMLLPNKLVYALAVFAVLFAAALGLGGEGLESIYSAVIGSVVFGGFFYALYVISNERWIGGGDVRLGFVLGILLGWQKSILCLMFASYLGTLIILVLVIIRKYHKKMRIPFGPLLLCGAYAAMLWGEQLINWYVRLSSL